MIQATLTSEEFLKLPESNERYELVAGELIPKVSPQTPHSRCCRRLLRILDDWCEKSGNGEVNPEWAIALKRSGRDWVPIPDLAYVSNLRLPQAWDQEGPCPVAPELVVEIISPEQTFGEVTEKATNYLVAGVGRVWVVDTTRTITVFAADSLPKTFRGEEAIQEPLLPELMLTAEQVLGVRKSAQNPV